MPDILLVSRIIYQAVIEHRSTSIATLKTVMNSERTNAPPIPAERMPVI